jgi:DNA-3-methyladenine glycosylase (3mg)
MNEQFYMRDTLTVAQDLLGKYFVRNCEGGPIVCKITETEAYIGKVDRACHAFGYRQTPRTAPLFLPAGHAYIYFVYGMHHCFNFVTEPEGEPAAVLLRGLSSCHGADLMSRNRFGRAACDMTAAQRRSFLNGPGKVCQALELTRSLNGVSCVGTGDAFYVCDSLTDLGLPAEDATRPPVHCGPRIGVNYAGEDALLPWRFWIDSAHVFC